MIERLNGTVSACVLLFCTICTSGYGADRQNGNFKSNDTYLGESFSTGSLRTKQVAVLEIDRTVQPGPKYAQNGDIYANRRVTESKWRKQVSKDATTLESIVNQMERYAKRYQKRTIPAKALKRIHRDAAKIDSLNSKYGDEIMPPKNHWDEDGQKWYEVVQFAHNTILDFIPTFNRDKPSNRFSNPQGTVHQVKFFSTYLKKYKKLAKSNRFIPADQPGNAPREKAGTNENTIYQNYVTELEAWMDKIDKPHQLALLSIQQTKNPAKLFSGVKEAEKKMAELLIRMPSSVDTKTEDLSEAVFAVYSARHRAWKALNEFFNSGDQSDQVEFQTLLVKSERYKATAIGLLAELKVRIAKDLKSH